MFVVTVTFDILKDRMAAFLPLMLQNAQTSLSHEPGCLRFDVCTDESRPSEVFLYEIYADAAAFDTHLQSPHFKTFDAQTATMIASKTVKTYAQVTP
ncbi:MAG: putative quinol monooxygenase [Pseudomonadota bacterium]